MATLTSSKPPVHRRAIVLCVDQAFFKYAMALIARIHDRLPNLAADICLVSEAALDVPASLSHVPVRLCRMTVDRGNLDFPVSDKITFASYLRLFAIQAMADTYDRILYLDSDIHYVQGDLDALLDIPLQPDHAIGAVRDVRQHLDLQRRMSEHEDLDVPSAPYFNAGVLVVDTARWTKANILTRSLKCIAEMPHALHLHDQSALNLVLNGDWSEMSPVWNWIPQEQQTLYLRTHRPCLLHFTWVAKPWDQTTEWIPAKFTSWYDTFLTRHFDGYSPLPAQPQTLHPTVAARAASQLRAYGRARRFARRFPSHHQTINPRA